jgi:competence protein ComEC
MFHRLSRYKPGRVTLVGFILAGVLLGLFLARFNLYLSVQWLILLPFISFTLIKPRFVSIATAVMAGFILGSWRGGVYYQKIDIYQDYFGKKVVLTGSVLDDTSYDESRQTEFHVGNIKIYDHSLPGRVRVRGFGANSVSRGDRVKVVGNLNRTIGTSQQASMSYSEISVIGKNNSLVEKVRRRFFAAVYSSLPEPQASLGLGFLVGVRTALPKDISDQLALVGLTHIIAVSGYNLTIIVQMIRKLFAKRSAYQSVIFSIGLIVLFLMMTGWSPSIMRAAIVTGFSLVAWYYGRTILPIILILLGGAVTGFINPLYVWGDAGWYLSFLAFTGVLILSPIVISLLYKDKKPNFLIAILIETLSAIIFTAPYIAWMFGKISIIAPIANVIIGPLIPACMLTVFMVGALANLSPTLALWVAVFPRALLSFVVWIVEKLSTIPFAQVKITVRPVYVVLSYCVLALITFAFWRVQKNREIKRPTAKIDWNLI